jgi:hypothetical protein
MLMSRLVAWWGSSLCVALLVACGAQSESSPAGSAGSSNGGSDDTSVAGDSTSATSGNASSGTGAGGTNGASGASNSAGNSTGAAGASNGAEMPLVPVTPGHVLTFTATTLDPAQPLVNGPCVPLEAKIEAPLSVQGHSGVGYHGPCSMDAFLLEGSGDQLTAHKLEADAITRSYEYIHSPVVDGESWDINGATQTWHPALAPVETPAGTFSDCWVRVAEELRITYCRGIGLVDLWDAANNYELKLVTKNF